MRRLLLVGLVTLFGFAACGTDTDTTSNTTDSAVSQGAASQDASKDVVITGVTPGDFGFATPHLTVTNNSSKRSDYYIEGNVVNQTDDSVLGFTNAVISNLEPGATAKVNMVDVEWKSTYAVVITEVQRTASV